jgi:hypothetical protein
MDQTEIDKILDGAKAKAEAVGVAESADVIFFNGDLRYAVGYDLVIAARNRRRKQNAIVIPVTEGGSADTAYRMARYLQRAYAKGIVRAFVPSLCKSAGTLLVAGAHQLYMGDLGELGPLDIQLSKKDELWEFSSGLNVDAAILALQETADKMFFDYLHRIKQRNSSVTYRTAADISVELTSRLLSPIYAQIDPAEIGENSRSMDITKNYAKRLDEVSKNFISPKTMNFLVESYPDHGFVIDRTEAAEIFKIVKPATKEMGELEEALGKLAHDPIDWERGIQYEVRFLTDEPKAPLAVVEKENPGGTP